MSDQCFCNFARGSEGSKIIVYFGEEIAKHVLEQTLKEFIDPTQP